jgi:hypothetical protein
VTTGLTNLDGIGAPYPIIVTIDSTLRDGMRKSIFDAALYSERRASMGSRYAAFRAG